MITLSSRLTDRLSEDEKHIKENDRRVATYRRYYPNLWKRWVSSVVSEGRWHLYLTVRERNGTEIEIRESKKKDRRFKFISNVFWDVWVNGEKRGSMRTDQSWKI